MCHTPSLRSILLIAAEGVILSDTMKRWSWHRAQALALAVLLGLGMSLPCVQGGVMAADMAIAADGAHHASGRLRWLWWW